MTLIQWISADGLFASEHLNIVSEQPHRRLGWFTP
jgi:hypothetical protein